MTITAASRKLRAEDEERATVGEQPAAASKAPATPLIKAQLGRQIDEELDVAQVEAPLEGRVEAFDHVTFWVGNAKQSAVFYMSQFGFQPFAFRGLETGSRELACHVVRLNDTIIQFVSAVKPNNRALNDFLLSHGDSVKDVAFRVHNIEALLEHALAAGAELVHPLEVLVSECESAVGDKPEADCPLGKCVTKRATIKTFGDVTHTFVERNYDYEPGRFLPGYHKPSLDVSES